EVFDFSYAEIAQITGRDEAACRQLFSRARKHVRENRPRFAASPEDHARILDRFMAACLAGDMDSLTSLLAEDITVWSDGGGKVTGAARKPLHGRESVARALLANLARAPQGTTVEVIEANGLPAILTRVEGQVVAVITMEVADGLIQAVRTVANPDKLAHLNQAGVSGSPRRFSL